MTDSRSWHPSPGKGGPSRHIWDDLIAKIAGVERLALQAQPWLLEYDPFLPEDYLSAQTEQVLNQIIEHFARSGRIKGLNLFMHREWKELIEHTKVKGQHPQSREHFIALLMQIQLYAACKDLASRWQRQMAVLGAPATAALGPELERICKQYVYQLQQCLTFFTSNVLPCVAGLRLPRRWP